MCLIYAISRLGDKNSKIFDFKWVNDFSKARNFSISKATKDWILILDADEIIKEKGLEKIKELVNKDADAYVLVQKNYSNNRKASGFKLEKTEFFEGFYPSNIIRLFKNNKGIIFDGAVHEEVDSSVKGKIVNSNIDIEHFQFLKGKEFVQEKLSIAYIRPLLGRIGVR